MSSLEANSTVSVCVEMLSFVFVLITILAGLIRHTSSFVAGDDALKGLQQGDWL